MSDTSIVDPFGIVDVLKTQNNTAVDRAKQADTFLSSFMAENDKVQVEREANLKAAVEAKAAVNTTVQTESQNLTKTIQPLFQRRTAIADRQAEMVSMNPITRLFKGITDRGYNPTDLARADEAAKQQIQAHGQLFQETMRAQGTILQGIEEGYNSNDAILQLHAANQSQDAQLLTQLAGSAAQVFGAELQGLQAQGEVVRAQSLARQNLLSGMTAEQVNQAFAQANAAPNKVAVVNGVPLRAGELRDLQMSWQEKDLSLRSRQVALAAGQIDLANAQEAKLISHMTSAELESAVAGGGKYRGQTLNQELLTRALAADSQKKNLIADQAFQASGVGVATRAIQSVAQGQEFLRTRSAGIFGQVPREVEQQGLNIAARVTQYQEGLARATQSGAGAAYVAQNMPELQKMQADQMKLAEDLSKRFSTNRDAQATAMGWLTGQTISGETNVKGLISLARTGLPAGVRLSGAAQQQFQRVQQMVTEHDKGGGPAGQGIDGILGAATGRGTSATQREQSFINDVTKAMQSSYNATSMNDVIKSAPTIAANVRGENGLPLSLSRVPVQEFNSAVASGDRRGLEIIGRQLNLRPEQVETMFSQGPTGAAFQNVQKNKKDADFSALQRQLLSAQTQATMVALDQTSVAHDGFKPSAAYAAAMQNPQFQQQVMTGIANRAQGNLGEYIIGGVAPNSFDSTFYQYSQHVGQAYADVQHNALMERARVAPEILGNPVRFADAAIGAVPGITDAEHRALYAAMVSQIQQQPGYRPAGLEDPANTDHPTSEASQIDAIITQGKFADPAIESVRRKAAAAWEQSKASARGSLRALSRENH